MSEVPEGLNVPLREFAMPDGTLVPIEYSDLPFEPKRVFWIQDVPEGHTRGNHAHRECHQIIIAITGTFRLYASQPNEPQWFAMGFDCRAVWIAPLTWVIIDQISPGAVILVLASHPYDPYDYINDYDELLQLHEDFRTERAGVEPAGAINPLV